MDKYSSLTADAEHKSAKFRKYDDSYIKFGFIENCDGRTECVMCLKVLANEAMKPVKLKRLITMHLEYKERIIFQSKERGIRPPENTNGESGHNFRDSTEGFLFGGSGGC